MPLAFRPLLFIADRLKLLPLSQQDLMSRAKAFDVQRLRFPFWTPFLLVSGSRTPLGQWIHSPHQHRHKNSVWPVNISITIVCNQVTSSVNGSLSDLSSTDTCAPLEPSLAALINAHSIHEPTEFSNGDYSVHAAYRMGDQRQQRPVEKKLMHSRASLECCSV